MNGRYRRAIYLDCSGGDLNVAASCKVSVNHTVDIENATTYNINMHIADKMIEHDLIIIDR